MVPQRICSFQLPHARVSLQLLEEVEKTGRGVDVGMSTMKERRSKELVEKVCNEI